MCSLQQTCCMICQPGHFIEPGYSISSTKTIFSLSWVSLLGLSIKAECTSPLSNSVHWPFMGWLQFAEARRGKHLQGSVCFEP